MDYATKMAIRAIVSGLRYSQRINDADCEAIVQALAEAAEKARDSSRRDDGERLDDFGADIARDCFGADHAIALAARRRAEGR